MTLARADARVTMVTGRVTSLAEDTTLKLKVITYKFISIQEL